MWTATLRLVSAIRLSFELDTDADQKQLAKLRELTERYCVVHVLRDGKGGELEMGARHGAWCLGCCWALMAALFALGVMSLAWTAFVAALIALEKTLPWGRAVTWATAAVLLALAVTLVAAPEALPGLTVPGGGMHDAGSMGAMP